MSWVCNRQVWLNFYVSLAYYPLENFWLSRWRGRALPGTWVSLRDPGSKDPTRVASGKAWSRQSSPRISKEVGGSRGWTGIPQFFSQLWKDPSSFPCWSARYRKGRKGDPFVFLIHRQSQKHTMYQTMSPSYWKEDQIRHRQCFSNDFWPGYVTENRAEWFKPAVNTEWRREKCQLFHSCLGESWRSCFHDNSDAQKQANFQSRS